MTNNLFKKIFLVLVFALVFEGMALSQLNAKKETTEQEDIANEFKETKFLQIDKLDVPSELIRIEDQIKQNAVDVIISSKTHTPLYSQKRENGYTDSYKNFHGLHVQIVPIPKEQDFYSLTLFYYNWTTNKYDKRLRKRISKYNVLNELRFALYELLLGKQFVFDHKDEIEKQNYERIVGVREAEELQKRLERKKKKLDVLKKNELELENQKKEDKKKKKLMREEKEKKEKKEKKESKENLENKQNSAAGNSSEDPGNESDKNVNQADQNNSKLSQNNNVNKDKNKDKDQDDSKSNIGEKENDPNLNPAKIINPDNQETIPIKSFFSLTGNFLQATTVSEGLLLSTTSLKFLAIGARYNQEKEIPMPTGMSFSLYTGLPIKKDNYAFPVYRAFETEMYKRNILGHFKILGGLDYSPIYFINLANEAEGLVVFENDIFWLKGGVAFTGEIKRKQFDLRVIFLKSLSVSDNQNKTLSGTSLLYRAFYQHTQKHGFELTLAKTYLVGDLQVDNSSTHFSYIYKFEN